MPRPAVLRSCAAPMGFMLVGLLAMLMLLLTGANADDTISIV